MLLRRNRTSSKYIFYALHLYISGLSLRKTSKYLSGFVKGNHVSIWNWIQHYKPEKISYTKRRIYEFIVDETLIKVGGEFAWLWIASKPKDKTSLE
jgi:putative transposase